MIDNERIDKFGRTVISGSLAIAIFNSVEQVEAIRHVILSQQTHGKRGKKGKRNKDWMR